MSTSLAMTETSVDSIPTIFKDLRSTFNTGKTKSIAWRKRQIEQLFKMCNEQKEVFASAVNADFNRPSTETLLYDCGVVSYLVNLVILIICLLFYSFVMNVLMFLIILMNGQLMKNVPMLLHTLQWINMFIVNLMVFV